MQRVGGEGCQRNFARSGFDRVSTLMFVITRIIAFLVLQWSEMIVTADEDLPMTTTDVSSLLADRDDTRRFLFLPFLNGLINLILFQSEWMIVVTSCWNSSSRSLDWPKCSSLEFIDDRRMIRRSTSALTKREVSSSHCSNDSKKTLFRVRSTAKRVDPLDDWIRFTETIANDDISQRTVDTRWAESSPIEENWTIRPSSDQWKNIRRANSSVLLRYLGKADLSIALLRKNCFQHRTVLCRQLRILNESIRFLSQILLNLFSCPIRSLIFNDCARVFVVLTFVGETCRRSCRSMWRTPDRSFVALDFLWLSERMGIRGRTRQECEGTCSFTFQICSSISISIDVDLCRCSSCNASAMSRILKFSKIDKKTVFSLSFTLVFLLLDQSSVHWDCSLNEWVSGRINPPWPSENRTDRTTAERSSSSSAWLVAEEKFCSICWGCCWCPWFECVDVVHRWPTNRCRTRLIFPLWTLCKFEKKSIPIPMAIWISIEVNLSSPLKIPFLFGVSSANSEDTSRAPTMVRLANFDPHSKFTEKEVQKNNVDLCKENRLRSSFSSTKKKKSRSSLLSWGDRSILLVVLPVKDLFSEEKEHRADIARPRVKHCRWTISFSHQNIASSVRSSLVRSFFFFADRIALSLVCSAFSMLVARQQNDELHKLFKEILFDQRLIVGQSGEKIRSARQFCCPLFDWDYSKEILFVRRSLLNATNTFRSSVGELCCEYLSFEVSNDQFQTIELQETKKRASWRASDSFIPRRTTMNTPTRGRRRRGEIFSLWSSSLSVGNWNTNLSHRRTTEKSQHQQQLDAVALDNNLTDRHFVENRSLVLLALLLRQVDRCL